MDMRLLWRLTAPLGGAPRDLRLSSGRLPRRRLHLNPPPWGLQAPAYTRRGLPEDRRRGSAGHGDRDPFQSSRQDLATWMCGGLLILQGLALPTPPARGQARKWSYPRYAFSNLSPDIRQIFMDTCDLLGLRWTSSGRTVYVSRKADVEVLDSFVGP